MLAADNSRPGNSCFFIIPNLTPEKLNSLAYHIVGVTTLGILFVVLAAGIRVGGLG